MENPKIIRSHRPIHEDSCNSQRRKMGCDSVTKMGPGGVRWNPIRWQMLGGFQFFELSMMFGMFGTKTRPLSAWSELMLIGVDCS